MGRIMLVMRVKKCKLVDVRESERGFFLDRLEIERPVENISLARRSQTWELQIILHKG